jgi:hypothetical protein
MSIRAKHFSVRCEAVHIDIPRFDLFNFPGYRTEGRFSMQPMMISAAAVVVPVGNTGMMSVQERLAAEV